MSTADRALKTSDNSEKFSICLLTLFSDSTVSVSYLNLDLISSSHSVGTASADANCHLPLTYWLKDRAP